MPTTLEKIVRDCPTVQRSKTEGGKSLIHTENNEVRYVLGDIGDKPLICIGVNPSVSENDDGGRGTILTVEKVKRKNNHGSWVMLNVYPVRAKNANKLSDYDAVLDEVNRKIIEAVLEDVVKKTGKPPTVWVAWGVSIEKKPYLLIRLCAIISLLEKHNCHFVTCGKLTVAGHPHHPLGVCDIELKDFDMIEYKRKLGCHPPLL